MKKTVLALLLCALSLCAFGKDCRIMGGAYETFLVKAGSAAMTKEARSAVIQERMNDVMSLEQAPAISLEKQKDGAVILRAGGVYVATVGKRDAEAGPGSCMSVARLWGEGISRVYSLAAADRNKPLPAQPKLKGKKRTRKYRR